MSGTKDSAFAKGVLSCGGIGFLPSMPGTVASSVALFLLVGLDGIFPLGSVFRASVLALLIIGITFLGLGMMQMLGKVEDYKWIVLDEVLGMIVAVSPLFFWYDTGFWWFVGLAFFRLFDIWKPLGITFIDQQGTKFSILLDDLVAGGYSAIALTLLLYVAG